MKNENTKFAGGNAAERQARKKKRMLIALAGITLLTWSRTMLGGDAEPAARTPATAPAGTPTTAAAARPAAKQILTFEQASERMKTWPAALERRSIEGAISDLTPAYWTTALAAASEPEPVKAAPTAAAPAAAVAAPPPSPLARPPSFEHEESGELGLRLRSTALLGAHRYAVIGNTRYAEGALIQVPGFGEVLLESVRSREAVLRKGQRTWTLTIANAADDEGI